MRQHNDSERKVQALPATAIQPHARKGVENNCVFSLSILKYNLKVSWHLSIINLILNQ